MNLEPDKITEQEFLRLKDMIESSDKENVSLGFTCIDNLNIEANLVYVIALLRTGNKDHFDFYYSTVAEEYLKNELNMDLFALYYRSRIDALNEVMKCIPSITPFTTEYRFLKKHFKIGYHERRTIIKNK